jgi:hypothetical protein
MVEYMKMIGTIIRSFLNAAWLPFPLVKASVRLKVIKLTKAHPKLAKPICAKNYPTGK